MYQNMPTTPTTSTQTAAINSSKSAILNKNTNSKNSKFVKSSPENSNSSSSRDPTNEIEEISKKISEHAEAIYRTWKSRGLAPTELLEFYANANPRTATTTTTQISNTTKKPIDADIVAATNDFLATVASDTATTEGLQQLVNSFVLKDKEMRAASKNNKDNIMTGKSNIQKAMTGGTSMKSPTSTIKSAIIMKDDEKVPVTPVKNIVILKKTTKTTSAPLTSIIRTSTATATTTTNTNTNTAAAKTKQKIGNNTLQQQQPQSTSLTTTTTATTTKTRSKKMENSENDNNNSVGATTKLKQKKTNICKTIDRPSVEINLNMDLNLNLHINDVNNLSKFQTENLIKINELLDDKTTATTMSGIVLPSSVVKNTTTATTPTPITTTPTTTSAINKNNNKSAKILPEHTKTPTQNNSTYSNENNNNKCNITKKVSNVGDSKKVTGAAAVADDDVNNCDRILMGNENLQVSKAKSKAKAIGGNKGLFDKNSDVVDSVGEVDGKISDSSIATKITTKSMKINKINKNLIGDLVNNNKSNNARITSKPVKTSTTSTTITSTIPISTTTTVTTTAQSIVTSTANISAAIATAKETEGNSGNVSVLSDSSRNGTSKNRIKITTTKSPTSTTTNITTTTTTTTTITTTDERKNKSIKNPVSSNNTEKKDITSKIHSESKSEEQKNMALVRSNSTSSMPTGSTKMKTARSNSLTNGTADKNNPAVARPFLTRGSVAERVMMFEKCPDARHSFLNIKRPDPAEAPPKSLLKVKLHATPPPPPEQNSLQREYRNTKSVYIPRFYFPHGKPQPQIAMERTVRNVLGAFDAFPNNQVTKDELPRILKICGIPFYWRMPVMVFCQQHNSGLVERQRFIEFWKQMNVYCHDAASRFVYILSRGQRMRSYILPEDLAPMVQDVVDTHPGLAFLKEATEFHSRYVHTVIARIFYSVNRSWSGRISISELKKSDLLEIITLLEEEDDINQIMAFFSYEHFYVIYCKFWELDKDHDLLINQEDLARHSDHALSTRIVERIFSGCVTRNDNKKDNDDEPKMSYTDFVWFLLSEEDKRSPTAIEYWFRCMDIDGDGVLSMYELEYFYEEQQQRMESIGIETLPFEDCLCQMLDMIKPQRRDCVTLGDLKRCKMTHVFFDTFFNLEKYLDHEQRDPFASQRDEYPSDWDRFAAQEYELLITEEN